MDVPDQVAILFAGVNSYLDDIPVDDVKRFQTDFAAFLQAKHFDLLKSLASDITKDVDEKLRRLLEAFKKEHWKAS